MRVNLTQKSGAAPLRQPEVLPSQVQEAQLDQFENPDLDGVNRLRKTGVNVCKRMMHEFLVAPQLLYMGTANNWTLVPSGTIAFRFEQKLHEVSDPFVKDCELRTTISKELMDESASQVVWSERAGIVEPGLGLGGTLPICTPFGFGAALNLGFQANTLLCYRIIRPVKLGRDEPQEQANKETTLEVPLDAAAALRMSKGTEFELIGSGRLSSLQGPVVFEGLDVIGISTFGVGASVVANEAVSAEYRLRVIALDGRGKMRVTIEKIKKSSVGVTAKLMGGLIGPTNSLLPQWGDGVLAYLLQNRIQNPLQNLLANIWSVHMGATLAHERSEDKLYCFDLDLNDQQTHEAYKKLLWLDPREAQKLCAKPRSSASRMEWKEKEWRTARSLEVCALNDQMYLREVYKAKRKGELIHSRDSKALYIDGIYGRKFKNVFRGDKAIRWESVKIDDNKGAPRVYYGFFYNKFDRIPRQSSINRFFGFAKSLGICSEVKKCSKLIDLPFMKKVLSSADDTKTKVELFFSEAGVERIQRANTEDGIRAFLQARALADSYYEGHPFLTSEGAKAKKLFYDYMTQHFSGENEKLKETVSLYFEAFDRDLKNDFEVYCGAKNFGKKVGKWTSARDKRDAADFFTWMGKSKSFRYTDVLPALAILAGRQNVIVHALSMEGGGISIKSVDEGEIVHPRDQARNLVNSYAFRPGA